MKSLTLWILLFVLVSLLAACSGNSDTTDNMDGDGEADSSEEATDGDTDDPPSDGDLDGPESDEDTDTADGDTDLADHDPDTIDGDADGDAEPDAIDGDTDGDAEPDAVDGDADGDAEPDAVDGDADGDAEPDAVDGDTDMTDGDAEAEFAEEDADWKETDAELSEDFAYLPPGTFWMGSPDGYCPAQYPGTCIVEPGRYVGEELHRVTRTYETEIGKYEVTREEWNTLISWDPSHFSGCGEANTERCPVENVTWYDTLVYANKRSLDAGVETCYLLSDIVCEDGTEAGTDVLACMSETRGGIDTAAVALAEGLDKPQDCAGYRLPTEAEWEFAARTGNQYTAFYRSDGNDGLLTVTPIDSCDTVDPNLDQIAVYCANDSGRPEAVGGKEANDWGIHDMLGNVQEWVWDLYWFQNEHPESDPTGAPYGTQHAVRGGYYTINAQACRSATRVGGFPDWRHYANGFRLARTLFETADGDADFIDGDSEAPDGDADAIDGDTDGVEVDIELTQNSVRVSAGTFWMGSPDGTCPAGYPGACVAEPGRYSTETLHEVTLATDFEMMATEVTQEDWTAHMVWNPSHFSAAGEGAACGDDCPVESVSWYDALVYANVESIDAGLPPCYALTCVICEDDSRQDDDFMACMNGARGGIKSATAWLTEGLEKPQDCRGYRLPTEAEWEFAARAGNQYTTFYRSDGNDGTIDSDPSVLYECDALDANLDQIAVYCGNDPGGTVPVGAKEANALGLFDMSGNVNEWCWDWSHPLYQYDVGTDPSGPPSGQLRSRRGGSWDNQPPRDCRSASRGGNTPGLRDNITGLRLVRSLP